MRGASGVLASLAVAVPLGIATAAAAQVPAVDPAVVGTWIMDVPTLQGGGALTWAISGDGTYDFHSEGGVPQEAHSGIVTFNRGAWSMTATAGLVPWVDGGSYRLQGPDVLVAKGTLGTGVWQREQPGADGAVTTSPRLPTDLPALLAPAAERARQWQGDAVAVDIRVERSLIDPREFDLSFDFYSPSTGAAASVLSGVPLEDALVERGKAPAPAGAVPAEFVDLATAVQVAAEHGMAGGPRSATLSVREATDAVAALVWDITDDRGVRRTVSGSDGTWIMPPTGNG